MDEKKKLWTALKAIEKRLDFEQLKYSDYMYGKEALTEEVWAYVEEFEEIGRKAFMEKYVDLLGGP